MDAIRTLPWWVGFPASIGFAVMGIVAPSILPIWAQTWLFGAGALAVAGSALAGAWHYRPKRAAAHMPFRDVVRRAALHSEWGLSYGVREQSWPTWQDDLRREILHKLTEKPPNARGIRNVPGQPEDSAPTLIAPEFWPRASFFPEHMLVDNQTGMVFQKDEPCSLLYMDVTISRADVDELWPAVPKRRRAGRVSRFAALAREWYDAQEDARLNRNPGVGFDVAWNEGVKRDGVRRSASETAELGSFVTRMIEHKSRDKAAQRHTAWDGALQSFEEAEHRRSLIAKGRDVVHRWRRSDRGERFEIFASKDRDYLDIQPYLGHEYQAERARRGRTAVFDVDVEDYYAAQLLRELRRLEEEWGIA